MHLAMIFQAFLARCLFFVHSFVAIWRCVDVLKDSRLWLITLANIALIIETLITCFKRKGRECKWFSPAIFIYLCAAVPPIWFLELDRLEKFGHAKGDANATTITETLSAIQGITIPIELPANLWVTVIEQLLLLSLIVGRWIMPKGEISRDALSQLLFVYIGMSSDIMELFVLFEEEKLLENVALSYIILSFWTLSLLQFCFVLTATKNPKRARISLKQPEGGRNMAGEREGCCHRWFTTEAWSIFVSLFMQDGPFLCIRMYTIIRYQVITYNTIFFTCKNILVTMLLVYRLFVVCTQKNDEDGEKVKAKRSTLIRVTPCGSDLEKEFQRINEETGSSEGSDGSMDVNRKPSLNNDKTIGIGDKVVLVGQNGHSHRASIDDKDSSQTTNGNDQCDVERKAARSSSLHTSSDSTRGHLGFV